MTVVHSRCGEAAPALRASIDGLIIVALFCYGRAGLDPDFQPRPVQALTFEQLEQALVSARTATP
jgi:hypothetical protein